MKKILIVYATAGIGHKKAAMAVKKALDELAPKDVEVSLIDALDYTPGSFKRSYLQLYLLAVSKLSMVWGFMYYLTDNFYVNLVVAKIRRLSNWMNSRRLVKYLYDFKPDVIVSTHFFASEVVSDLKRKKLIDTKLITIVTDYRLHSWWIAGSTDTYIVSNDDAKSDLIRWGIPVERIKVAGIPIEPAFARVLDAAQMRGKFGLKDGYCTILVIGGGFGVGPIEGIVKAIDEIPREVQAVIVCGHNEELLRKIEGLSSGLKMPVKVLGFVDNVHEYMSCADILISKAGGITVSESLAKELPMIVIAPIPGQETGNSEFMVRYGAAVRIDDMNELKTIVNDLAGHPEKLEAMKVSIRHIRKPDAAYDVAKIALEA